MYYFIMNYANPFFPVTFTCNFLIYSEFWINYKAELYLYFLFHAINMLSCYQHDLSLAVGNLVTWPRESWSRKCFLLSKVTFIPFHTLFLGTKSLSPAILKGTGFDSNSIRMFLVFCCYDINSWFDILFIMLRQYLKEIYFYMSH